MLTVDNRAFRQTGPEQGLAVVDLNSFTQLGEKTELSIYHTNGSTQNFGQASSEFFVGGSGLKLKIYGGYGKADPSDYLRVIGYEGFTTTFGMSASYTADPVPPANAEPDWHARSHRDRDPHR